MFSTGSHDPFTSVTCANCEPALIGEENGGANGEPANFDVLCQMAVSTSQRTLGPHSTLMVSISHEWSEVMLLCSGSAPRVPPRTKEQIPVLLLGCCPYTALSSSPCVMAASWYLVHALETVLGDTANLLTTAHGPSWRRWATSAT
ncbi:hypothetical protein VZT92_023058 [Zoarces viviparus]|uniref:Uncharacterized protein n=1 Tax=Zoarces viviparus TaxID=48416 RepID=A0AAW1E6C0_ZOAVI